MDKINIFLSKQERENILKIPDDISRAEIIKNYALTDFDLKLIKECRLNHNKIGFAVQVGILKHKGWNLKNHTYIPKGILILIGKQLNIKPKEYRQYFSRKQTVTSHLKKIKQQYGYIDFKPEFESHYINQIKNRIKENESSVFLVQSLIEMLKKDKIIVPRVTTLEKIAKKSFSEYENEIYETINSFMNCNLKQQLDLLLEYNEEQKRVPFSWLRTYNGKSSPEEFLETIDKIETIKDLNLNFNLNLIPTNKIEFFIRIGKRYAPSSLKSFSPEKRHAILAVFLNDLH